jgi:hypothetical protein
VVAFGGLNSTFDSDCGEVLRCWLPLSFESTGLAGTTSSTAILP